MDPVNDEIVEGDTNSKAPSCKQRSCCPKQPGDGSEQLKDYSEQRKKYFKEPAVDDSKLPKDEPKQSI